MAMYGSKKGYDYYQAQSQLRESPTRAKAGSTGATKREASIYKGGAGAVGQTRRESPTLKSTGKGINSPNLGQVYKQPPKLKISEPDDNSLTKAMRRGTSDSGTP